MHNFFTANLASIRAHVARSAAWWITELETRQSLVEAMQVSTRTSYVSCRMPGKHRILEQCRPSPSPLSDGDHRLCARILVGSGLGQSILRILENTPLLHRLFVIEPDTDTLAACLNISDFSEAIESGQLVIIPPNQEGLQKALANLEKEYFFGKILLLGNAANPRTQVYEEWTDILEREYKQVAYNFHMLRTWQDTWIKNEISNLPHALASEGITSLRDSACGVTAAVYGAGPSLPKAVHALGSRIKNLLLTTSLQTLPALLRNNLTPHLCLASDGSPGLCNVLDNLDVEQASAIPLFYYTRVHPRIIQEYPGPKIPIWFPGGFGPTFGLDGSAFTSEDISVSETLVKFLAWCGIDQFILGGMDLSWKAPEQARTPGHHRTTLPFDPLRHVRLTNSMGEPIISAPCYVDTARSMESLAQAPELTIYNLYFGGVSILGTREITNARSLPSPQSGPERFIEKIQRIETRPSPRRITLNLAPFLLCLDTRIKDLAHAIRCHEQVSETHRKVLHGCYTLLQSNEGLCPLMSTRIVEMAELVFARKNLELPDLQKALEILEQAKKDVGRITPFLSAQ